MYRIASCKIVGSTPYSQSNYYQTPRPEKMSAKDFEADYWREKMHVDEEGRVYIPPTSIKRATDEAAKRLAIQIPGRGKTQYTKFLEAGSQIVERITLLKEDGKPWTPDEAEHVWLWQDPEGKRGGQSSKKVQRCFPIFYKWRAEFDYHIMDDTITTKVFQKCVESGGLFVGIGRWRPENRGVNGRYMVTSIDVKELK